MQSDRLRSPFAALVLVFAISNAAAQPQAQQGQQGQQAQQAEIERLRRELEQSRPQQGQPLLVVPAAPPVAPPPPRPDLPTVELAPLLERVGRASNKRFVVDPRLGTRIYLSGVDADD